jgi:quercetin dioxygenase-like cupin family protein
MPNKIWTSRIAVVTLAIFFFVILFYGSVYLWGPVLAGHHEAGETSPPPEPVFIAQAADEIVLQAVPGLEGLTAAVLFGNPDKPGPYVLRIRFDKDVRSPPHSHDQDRFITVIEGTWHFGVGASGRCGGTKPLPAGSFAYHPKGAVHYDGSCGEPVTVEIRGEGPVTTDFVGLR